MRLATIEIDSRPVAALALASGNMLPLRDLLPQSPASLRGVLAAGPALLAAIQEAAADTDLMGVPATSVSFLPVIPDPKAVWGAAINYQAHGDEGGHPEFPYPGWFLRVADSLTGHQNNMLKPTFSTQFDYEGELVVVIGKGGRNIPISRAYEHVAGYACGNDGSVRDWQRHTTQIGPGKNFAMTGAVGPWLVTCDEFGLPGASRHLTTRVNGEVRQSTTLDQMLFDVPRLINYLSTIHSLSPGDLIMTGTPGGVGLRLDPPRFLEVGDRVEVEIDGIGALVNVVSAAAPAELPQPRDQERSDSPSLAGVQASGTDRP